MNKKIIFVFIFILCVLALFGCTKGKISVTTTDNVFVFDNLNDITYDIGIADEDFAYIEGNNIADGDYSFSKGKLRLYRDYLVTLAVGNYDFTIHSVSGQADISLVISDNNNKYKIINGGFETGDLFGWDTYTVFKGEDAIQSFVSEGIKANTSFFTFAALYNGDGNYVYGFDDRDGTDKDRWNERIGMMRSSVFELGGNGYISYKLGGAKNSDLCYISIRNADTDMEIARYSNQKFNSIDYLTDPSNYYEANLIGYVADLTDNIGQRMYIEVCDYGGRDWDLLTLDSFNTYLTSLPNYETAIDIKPTFAPHNYVVNQLPNGDFSKGLDDWTVSIASGWIDSIENNNAFRVDAGALKSNLEGDAARGLIRSSLFRVDGSGIISLNIGAAEGARYDKDTYVSIREEGTNRELVRVANSNHNGILMVKYYIDLSKFMGKNCYMEIIDNAKLSYDTIFVSDIVTYYEIAPAYDYGQTGINLNY